MKPIKPSKLKRGDVIGIVAPASAPTSQEKIDNGAAYLERLGYRVKLGTYVREVRGYLAGTDAQRASDLMTMFADRTVKAIIAVRGGYGTPRLLPLLDYSVIRKNPKIFVGYSDLTALQLAFYRKTGLVTFSGPMSGVEMWNAIDPFTEENFWSMITSAKKIGSVVNPDGISFEPLHRGKAAGILLGGNLSLIAAIAGTPYIPSFKNSIFFFEEIDEECYRFDRILAQITMMGILADAKGFLIGELTDVKPSDTTKPFLTSDEIIHDYFSPLSKPILRRLAYGHIPRKVTMPIGVRAQIDAGAGAFHIMESAVS